MTDARAQFREAIVSAGLTPPEEIEADGKLRRFAANGKRNDKAGWYLLHGDGIPAGSFGDWRTGLVQTWRAEVGRKLTSTEQAAHRARIEAMQRAREAEEKARHAEAATKAAAIWKAAKPAAADHAYLIAKGIKAHGARLHKSALVIPMRSGGWLHSLQFIDVDGGKKFLTGGRVAGCYFAIGEPKGAAALLIAEGFATGATIHEATGHPVAVAFNAGNLEPVARALRAKFPELALIVCADDDAATEGNPGITKATAAARAVGGRLAIPEFGTDRPERATDFNDMRRLCGAEAVAGAIAKATAPAHAGNGADAKPRANSADGLLVSGTAGAAVYSLTEDNLAIVFAEQFGRRLRFAHDVGRWFVWDDSRWREDSTDCAFNWVRDLCRNLNREGKRLLAKAATAAAVERFARADRAFAMRGDEWNSNPWLLGTPGGTVDLKTGELRAANPADLITRSTLIAPAEGEPRLWRQFLAQATQGDEETELFLRQIFGYVLTGDTREECLFYLYGAGGNGKGTFVGAMFDILGDYATAASMDTFLASKFDRHSTDLAMLRGARAVIASETQKGRAWDEQRVKALTGGDMITARFMRADNFTYRPHFKLLLFGNHKPVLRTVDDAWRRRFHIIPFTHRPPKQDATLKERLRAEYPQILRWAIDGCMDWQQHGLVAPARVRAETGEYFSAQDQFQTWLDECCELDRHYAEPNAVLFTSWQRFSEAIGEQPGTSRALADELAAHGFRRVKDELGLRGRGIAGLRVKP